MAGKKRLAERLVEKKWPDDPVLHLDYTQKYEDSFYQDYIKAYQIGKKPNWFYRVVKRLFDITVSGIGILILAVPFAVIALLIRLDSKGEAIFKNRRVGRYGKVFNCLKFRTMAKDAPHEVATSEFTDSAAYITKIGRFLRKTSIDELPQLFNVFVGQMSFIGYRPILTTEEQCNEMRERLNVFSARPGISGLAQVSGRDDVYYKNKALLDAYYVKNASFGLDFNIVWESVVVTLTGDSNWDSKEK